MASDHFLREDDRKKGVTTTALNWTTFEGRRRKEVGALPNLISWERGLLMAISRECCAAAKAEKGPRTHFTKG